MSSQDRHHATHTLHRLGTSLSSTNQPSPRMVIWTQASLILGHSGLIFGLEWSQLRQSRRLKLYEMVARVTRHSQQTWWFFGPGGQFQSQQIQYNAGDLAGLSLNVDYVVELNQIINFISQTYNAAIGITENQWNTVQAFIRHNGQRHQRSPSGDLWVCAKLFELSSGLNILRDVATRINTLKNRILLSLLPIADRVLTTEEARGLSEPFMRTKTQAQLAATSIGAAMDVIAGSTVQQAFQKAFAKWVVGQWTNAYFQMHMAAAPMGKRSMDEGPVGIEVGMDVLVF
ncbi:MAG: hypothetical protein Q9170_005223 [Blastenia crenularia]